MKRSTPLRRTSSLRTTSTLARHTRIAARSKTNKHARRERDFEYMGWVKHQPCIVRSLPPWTFTGWVAFANGTAAPAGATPCSGPIEADHAGDRFKDGGDGTRAHDRTCIPLCRDHHRQRHDHAGTFRTLTRDDMRAWRTAAIERTQTAWSNR